MIDIEHPEKYCIRGTPDLEIKALVDCGDRVAAVYMESGTPSLITAYKDGKNFWGLDFHDIIPKQEWEYRRVSISSVHDSLDDSWDDPFLTSYVERRPKGSTDDSEWERVE